MKNRLRKPLRDRNARTTRRAELAGAGRIKVSSTERSKRLLSIFRPAWMDGYDAAFRIYEVEHNRVVLGETEDQRAERLSDAMTRSMVALRQFAGIKDIDDLLSET